MLQHRCDILLEILEDVEDTLSLASFEIYKSRRRRSRDGQPERNDGEQAKEDEGEFSEHLGIEIEVGDEEQSSDRLRRM